MNSQEVVKMTGAQKILMPRGAPGSAIIGFDFLAVALGTPYLAFGSESAGQVHKDAILRGCQGRVGRAGEGR